MFRLKLQQWLFSFALLASLVSFSSHANTIPVAVNTTEWLYTKTSNTQALTYYVDYNKSKQEQAFLFQFYAFEFLCLQQNTATKKQLLFTEQNTIFNHFKTRRLIALINPHYTTNTVNALMF